MKLAVVTTLSCVASFFICAIPCGLLVARWLGKGVDVRDVGSGNIGSTNVVRAAGTKAGLLTLALDAGKGALAICLSRWAFNVIAGVTELGIGEAHPACLSMVYLACVCGHCFSPYLNFKGGKGIAVGGAVGFGIDWRVGLCTVAAFLLGSLLSKKVSLGSLCGAVAIAASSFLFHMSVPRLILAIFCACLAIARHHANIKRLAEGTEPDFKAGKGGK